MKTSSNFVRHISCPLCGSKDNRALYDDGHSWCPTCREDDQYQHGEEPQQERQRLSERGLKERSVTPLTDVFRAIPKRGLTEDAIKKYGIDINMNKDVDVAHRYPFFKNGQHVANKVRKRSEKMFYWEAPDRDTINSVELFGQHLFPAGSAKSITVTEGELDAPSAWKMLGSRYPVVSVTSASQALSDCKRNFEYLDSFEDIVLCYDADVGKERPDGTKFYPGQEAAKKCAELFAPGKCRILTLQNGKDPNDYLQNGVDPRVFTNEWYRAQKFRPDGLVYAKDMLDILLDQPLHFTVPYPWKPVNDMTYGIRLSELYLVMADTGAGKTTVFKEIAYSILQNPEVKGKGYGVGFLHLEETNYDTALGLLSIHNNKPYHLPDVERTREEIAKAHEEVLGDGRAILYDSFGSNDIDVIVAKIRHMVAMGCKYIFLDHLSIIVSDQAGDERKQLDEISTKLKTLTIEQDVAIFCVIHTNRSGQARGSAGPEKVANIHFSLSREKKDPDEWRRNVLKLEIEKNRFCGRTGPCLWASYNGITGRLEELDDIAIQKYEDGQSITDADLAW